MQVLDRAREIAGVGGAGRRGRRSTRFRVDCRRKRGIMLRRGCWDAEALWPGICKMRRTACPGCSARRLAQRQGELRQSESQIDEADTTVAKAVSNDDACRRRMADSWRGSLTAMRLLPPRKRRRVQKATLVRRMAGTGTVVALNRRESSRWASASVVKSSSCEDSLRTGPVWYCSAGTSSREASVHG